MKSLLKAKSIWVLALLGTLVAARPWDRANKTLGLEPAASDTLATALGDSLLMQPMTVVLPQAAVDTLTLRLAQRDSLARVRKDELAKADKDLAELDKKLATKRKKVQKKQQDIVTMDEIHNWTAKQGGASPDP